MQKYWSKALHQSIIAKELGAITPLKTDLVEYENTKQDNGTVNFS